MAARRVYAKKAAAGAGGSSPRRRLTRRRLAAIAAQVLSYLATLGFVRVFVDDLVTAATVAAVVEWLLFEFKGAVFSGAERWSPLGLASVVIDTLLNGGGMWAFVVDLDKSETYKMLSQGLNLGKDMRLLPALVIALALGFALSIGPHALWNSPANDEDEDGA